MRLHTQISGKGKPIIILHGFLGMGDNWKSISKKLSESFEVHLPDIRNHGKSDHHSSFNYDVMVDDMVEYFNTHQIKDAILIGHSMGGKIAMQFAAQNPKMVSQLIVVDISPKIYHPHHDHILKSLKLLKSQKLTSRKEADDVLKENIKEPGIRLFLMKNLKREENNTLTVKSNVDAFIQNRKEIGKALPKSCFYSGPTLFIKGEKSFYIREKDKDLISRHFPNSQIVSVENAGHWVHAENPDMFLKTTLDFIV